ncbi:anthrone oxygenase family protein [Conexibacter woesei]|uniref:DUF1772 domain-containing protein n=1 Tax=Conexibacter woesei (strain DSM 14684 / CCUG 47730 / CIP 108061 / JCM 11494 / NBRC 100937 / ID131577) TaxID=469383 RepID=D3FDI5_CONWI|nr:anthrone oxygenase family protein [Conexibacter woesei]ADB49559.1 Protein of unknown function DUF2266, transmembrane [Conexibacter woesei DSM 14684]
MSSQTTIDARPEAAPAVVMHTTRDGLVLGGATVAMGLLAGLFYSYAVSVMPGLHGAADLTVVDAMQNVNRAIENPVFFATFLGGPALALWALVDERRRGTRAGTRWVAAGAGLAVATLAITFAFNIPLNDALDAAGDPSRIADVAKVRDDFETPWVIWNVVRTVTVVASFACLTRALFLRPRRPAR